MEKVHKKEPKLFFIIYITLLAFAKGFYLSGTDRWYIGIALVSCFFWLIHMIVNRYSLKEYLRVFVLLSLCLLSTYYSHRLGILMLGMTIVGAIDITAKKMINWTVTAFATGYFFRIALALLGIIDNGKRVEWKFFFRREVTRYGLGFHPNILHAGFFILLVFRLYEKKRINVFEFVITQLLNVLLFLISYSVTGFVMCEVTIIGGFILGRIIESRSFVISPLRKILIYGMEGIPVVLSFLPALYYDPNNWWCYTIKGYTGGRTLWIYEFFRNYPITLFGQTLDDRTYSMMDNAFIYVLFKYGLVAFILIMVGYVFVIQNAIKKQDYIKLFICFLFGMYSFSEQFTQNCFMNFSLLFLCEVFWKERMVIESGNKIRSIGNL